MFCRFAFTCPVCVSCIIRRVYGICHFAFDRMIVCYPKNSHQKPPAHMPIASRLCIGQHKLSLTFFFTFVSFVDCITTATYHTKITIKQWYEVHRTKCTNKRTPILTIAANMYSHFLSTMLADDGGIDCVTFCFQWARILSHVADNNSNQTNELAEWFQESIRRCLIVT